MIAPLFLMPLLAFVSCFFVGGEGYCGQGATADLVPVTLTGKCHFREHEDLSFEVMLAAEECTRADPYSNPDHVAISPTRYQRGLTWMAVCAWNGTGDYWAVVPLAADASGPFFETRLLREGYYGQAKASVPLPPTNVDSWPEKCDDINNDDNILYVEESELAAGRLRAIICGDNDYCPPDGKGYPSNDICPPGVCFD